MGYSPNSLYYNIYLDIKNQIKEGKLKGNDLLLSERDYVKKYSTSRNTVRQALSLLKNEGLIYTMQGKGNFVNPDIIEQELDTFYSFHDKISSIGKTPSSVVLKYELLPCDDFFSDLFKVNNNSNIYYIQRLRLIDGEPAMLENTYIPSNRFKDFDFDELNKKAMYDIFVNEYGVMIKKAVEKFKPILVKNNEDMEYLDINKNTIVMEIIRKTYEYNKVIEYTISHVKDNLFEYTVVLNKF